MTNNTRYIYINYLYKKALRIHSYNISIYVNYLAVCILPCDAAGLSEQITANMVSIQHTTTT